MPKQSPAAYPDLLELRRIAPLYYEAANYAAGLESAAEEAAAAEACADELATQYEAVAERVRLRPVRSWADVIARAEIAYYWADKTFDGSTLKATVSSDCDMAEQTAAELIMAVLTVAKGGAHV